MTHTTPTPPNSADIIPPEIMRRIRRTAGDWYGSLPYPTRTDERVRMALRCAARITAHRGAANARAVLTRDDRTYATAAEGATSGAANWNAPSIPTVAIRVPDLSAREYDARADLMIGAALLACAREEIAFATANAQACVRQDAHQWCARRPGRLEARTPAGVAAAWRMVAEAVQPLRSLAGHADGMRLARAAAAATGAAWLEEARAEKDAMAAARLLYGAAITMPPDALAAAVAAMGGAIHAGERASPRARALAAYALDHAATDHDGAVARGMFVREDEPPQEEPDEPNEGGEDRPPVEEAREVSGEDGEDGESAEDARRREERRAAGKQHARDRRAANKNVSLTDAAAVTVDTPSGDPITPEEIDAEEGMPGHVTARHEANGFGSRPLAVMRAGATRAQEIGGHQ